MHPTVKFVAPSGRVRDIARMIAGTGGVVEGLGHDWSRDEIEVDQFLRLAAGQFVDVSFPGGNTSLVPWIANLLDDMRAPYFGYWPAGTCSLGTPEEGGFAVSFGDRQHGIRRSFDHVEGDPAPGEENLIAAGFDAEQVSLIVNFMLDPEPKPEPRPTF